MSMLGDKASETITDLTDPQLIAAVVNNQVAYRSVLGHAPIAEWHEEPGLTWYSSDTKSWVGNLVIRVQLAPDAVAARVQAVLDYVKQKGRTISWTVNPITQPADLGSYLEAHGMKGFSGIPNMVIDLETLPASNPPADLLIKRVDDAADVLRWVDTFVAAYELGVDEGKIFASALGNLNQKQRDSVLLYWATRNGQPLATAVVMLAEGVAGLYGVATMPTARRQGLGTLITLAALQEARAQGYRIAGLQASQQAYDLYRALGFSDLFYSGAYWLPDQA